MAERAKKVFVTGGNGFVASQILSDLIEQGYQVQTSVRSDAKAQDILNLHPDWKSQLSFVIVPEILAENAWDHGIKVAHFDYIIHTISPVDFATTDVQKSTLDPAIQGTTSILKAAHNLGGPQIKRFVLISSIAAVVEPFNKQAEAEAETDESGYTEDNWNPTLEYAIETKNPFLAYCVAKTLTEKAAWQFQSDHSPAFDLTVTNPSIVIGPMLQPVPTANSINLTNKLVYNFINGTYKDGDISGLVFPFTSGVDIRDVGRAHVLALTSPAASNQRIILAAGPFTPQLVVKTILKHFPELHDRINEGHPERLLREDESPRGFNTSKSHAIFGEGWKYRDVESSVVDTVKWLLEMEQRLGIIYEL